MRASPIRIALAALLLSTVALADVPPSPAPSSPPAPGTTAAPVAVPPPAPSPSTLPVPPTPVAASPKDDDTSDTEHEHDKDKSDASWWPSLLLEPGAGAVVSPVARGGATFGFSVGVVRLSTHNDRVSSLFGWHAGYTLAPGVDRGEITLTAGTGISGPFVLALRAGPTIDTNGVYGLRAGLRGTVYHGVGLELFMHHGFQPRNDTSVFMVFTVDLVPATMVFLFVGALNSLFK